MKLTEKVDQLLSEAEELVQSRGAALRLRAERQARWEAVLDRWCDLAELALAQMGAAEQERVEQAIEQANHFSGPYDQWLSDLADGRCRLPELSTEAMRSLLLAWLHPQAEGGIVCTSCGLEYPRHKSPPLSEWKLRPGKQPGEGPPPWYDLPELFQACPDCGGSPHGSGMDWPHLIDAKHYPWMDLDGYVGKPIQDLPEQSEGE